MMRRDFLARMESLKIEIKPDVMDEVRQQLDLWPPDRAMAYISDVTQLIIDKTGPHWQGDAGAMLDPRDKRQDDVWIFFALAMLRVYQIEDLIAAQSEDDQAQA